MVEPNRLCHVHAALAGIVELPAWPENPLPAAPGCPCSSGRRAHTAWIRGTLSLHSNMTHTGTLKIRPHTKISRVGAAV